MFSLLNLSSSTPDLINSTLYNEETFYAKFLKDLSKCHSEVLIKSPFITSRRLSNLLPILQKLKDRNVRIAINTRDPKTHDSEYLQTEATDALSTLQHMGIHVLYTSNHHRKLAILDRNILYEGSLNILSQNSSCEVMRRIESVKLAWQMVRFTKIDKYLN